MNNRTPEVTAAIFEVSKRFNEMNEAIYNLARTIGINGDIDAAYWVMKEHYKAYELIRRIDKVCDNLLL